MVSKHFDEARRDSITAIGKLLAQNSTMERIVLVDDLFGKIRVVIWGSKEKRENHQNLLSEALKPAGGPFWTDEIWHVTTSSETDQRVYNQLWEESIPVIGVEKLRLADRIRTRTAWFAPIGEPPWKTIGPKAGPPIVVFYSFKGGVGRTTALASFAIQKARAGESVAVLDFDVDAPGVGTLLAADDRGTIARWGVVDYLLERNAGKVDLRDYYHACRRTKVTGEGEIIVVPSGNLEPNGAYVGKLARLDFEYAFSNGKENPMRLLLEQIKGELKPKWICVDARAGLSEPAGLLLSGMAHLHVLFGTSSEQSWLGLRLVLERIGATLVREDRRQLDCVLVHAMVPQEIEAARIAQDNFSVRARSEFIDHYYASDPGESDKDDDRLWYVRDAEAGDAPNMPVAIPYQSKLAHYTRIDDIADQLVKEDYAELCERISARFRQGEI